jgi:hypothetical protein
MVIIIKINIILEKKKEQKKGWWSGSRCRP